MELSPGRPDHWRDLHQELDALGKQLSDIHGLVLTHRDSDHIGVAERLRREQGIPGLRAPCRR